MADIQFVDGQALAPLTLVKRAAATAFGCRKNTVQGVNPNDGTTWSEPDHKRSDNFDSSGAKL